MADAPLREALFDIVAMLGTDAHLIEAVDRARAALLAATAPAALDAYRDALAAALDAYRDALAAERT